MWLGKRAIQSYSPLRAGRERGVSPRETKGNRSFLRAEGAARRSSGLSRDATGSRESAQGLTSLAIS